MATAEISVVVTAYNHEAYIVQCLDSILMQKGSFRVEVILGDDCSTDNTRQIMQEYTEKYPDIFVLLPHTANMGITKNLKRCLDACRGDYIAICEGDDYWIDTYKLHKQLEFLQSHSDYALCFNAIVLHYENGQRYVPHAGQVTLSSNTLTIEDLIRTNYIGNFSCCMYRADVVRQLPEELFDMPVWDWMFNMACSQQGKVGFLRDWMSVYRIHPRGAHSGKSEQEKYSDLCRAVDFYDEFFNHTYHKQFSNLKKRAAAEYGDQPNEEAHLLKRYGHLLLSATVHPTQAYKRLRAAFATAHAELTVSAVSAKSAQLVATEAQLAIKNAQLAAKDAQLAAKDAHVAELTSAIQIRDTRIASFSCAVFVNTALAPTLARRLHVGCGNVKLPGWLNVDVEPGADLIIDVMEGLPFGDNSIDTIYNEHFLEHLTYDEGQKALREFWRCLKEGGVLRTATPDLDSIVAQYSREFKSEEWFPHGFEFVKTKGMAINMSFTWWGHKFLYNEEELRYQLTKASFHSIIRCEMNKSSHPELSNLETREESRLIIEAVKGTLQ